MIPLALSLYPCQLTYIIVFCPLFSLFSCLEFYNVFHSPATILCISTPKHPSDDPGVFYMSTRPLLIMDGHMLQAKSRQDDFKEWRASAEVVSPCILRGD